MRSITKLTDWVFFKCNFYTTSCIKKCIVFKQVSQKYIYWLSWFYQTSTPTPNSHHWLRQICGVKVCLVNFRSYTKVCFSFGGGIQVALNTGSFLFCIQHVENCKYFILFIRAFILSYFKPIADSKLGWKHINHAKLHKENAKCQKQAFKFIPGQN